VKDGINGTVSTPEPSAIADAISKLAADRAKAARLGEAGYARAKQISWDGVVERLVGAAGPVTTGNGSKVP